MAANFWNFLEQYKVTVNCSDQKIPAATRKTTKNLLKALELLGLPIPKRSTDGEVIFLDWNDGYANIYDTYIHYSNELDDPMKFTGSREEQIRSTVLAVARDKLPAPKDAALVFTEELREEYWKIHNDINKIMFGPETKVDDEPGSSIFNNDEFGIGSDDSHGDLTQLIIWRGPKFVSDFMEDPCSALPLAKMYSQDRKELHAELGALNKLIYPELCRHNDDD